MDEFITDILKKLNDQKETFVKKALESSGLSEEEFVTLYILEEGPIQMNDLDTNNVVFAQELKLRKRRPDEIIERNSNGI